MERLAPFEDGFWVSEHYVEPSQSLISDAAGMQHAVSGRAMSVLSHLAHHPNELVPFADLEAELPDLDRQSLEGALVELREAFDPDHVTFDATSLGLRLNGQVQPGNKPAAIPTMSIWAELRHRKVIRAATAYAISCFVFLQIADATFDSFPVLKASMPIILAVLAIGFPITISAAWFLEITVSGVVIDRRFQHFRRLGRPVEIGILVSLFVVGGAAGWMLLGSAASQQREQEAHAVPSIAILPFVNESTAADDTYLSDGLTHELIDLFQDIPEVRVISRRASFYYRGRELKLASIGQTLQVDHVLSGSISRRDGHIVVRSQLTNALGQTEWEGTLQDPNDNIVVIQQRIVAATIDALGVELSPESASVLRQAPTRDVRAYHLYLQGRDYLRRPPNQRNLDSAGRLFASALALDEQFMLARVGICEMELARYRITIGKVDFSKAATECIRIVNQDDPIPEAYIALGTLNRLAGNFDEALELFQRALRLAPANQAAVYGLARAYQGKGDIALAESTLRHGIELEPGYWAAYRGYGVFLLQQARPLEAVVQFKLEAELIPLDAGVHENLGVAYFDSNQWDLARAAWEKAIELERSANGLYNLATSAYYAGAFDEAAELLREATQLEAGNYMYQGKLAATLRFVDGQAEAAQEHFRIAADLAEQKIRIDDTDVWAMSYLASYLANLGEHERARAMIDKADAQVPANATVHYFKGVVANQRGDRELAEAALQQAAELGYSTRLITSDPQFDDLDLERIVGTARNRGANDA